MVAIRGPINNVKTSTRVSPGSVNTLIMPSSPPASPASGLNWASKVCPIQMPANNEGMTCLLQIASTIARSGGNTEYQVGSVIERLVVFVPVSQVH